MNGHVDHRRFVATSQRHDFFAGHGLKREILVEVGIGSKRPDTATIAFPGMTKPEKMVCLLAP